MLFVARGAVAIGTPDGLTLAHLSGGIQRLVDPDGSLWGRGPTDHQLVVATVKGQAYLVDTDHLQVTARAQLCHDPLSGLRSVPKHGMVAFACQEGTIGVWDPRSGAITPKAHLDGHASLLDASNSGEYLVAAGNKGTLTMIDLRTDIATPLQGQGFRLTAIAPPTEDYPFLVSADVRGGVRAWPLPPRLVSVLAETHERIYGAIYDSRDKLIVANTSGSELFTYSKTQGVSPVTLHSSDTPFMRPAAGGSRFATYGSSALVEIWSASPLVRTQILDTHHGQVTHVELVADTGEIVTSGKDGRLVRWSATGEQALLRQFDQPIQTFGLLTGNGSIVLATQDGAVWLIGKDRTATALGPAGVRVTQILALPDHVSACIGYASGAGVIWDARSPERVQLMRAGDAIRDIAVAADGRMIALVANDNTLHLGTRSDRAWTTTTATTWTSLTAPVRKAALTHDGLVVAICTDGTVWIYSSHRRTWLCLMTSTTELTQLMFDDTESTALLFDVDGRLISVDLKATRRALDA